MGLKERLFRLVSVKPSGCWEWEGNRSRSGHGRMWRDSNKKVSTHRMSYEIRFGEIPKNYLVLHKCNNPPCVNPEHLYLGTHKDNAVDMVRSGRNFIPQGEKCGMAKLNLNKVCEIIKLKGKMRITDIAKKYDVSRRAIQFVLNGETWA